MRQGRNRQGRKDDSRPVLAAEPSPYRGLRWFASLAAIAIVAGGGISAAQAAPGGASPYGGVSTEGQDSSAEGGVYAFSPTHIAGASWYGGPSLWGHKTACGETLHPDTLGVAHRKLPCGTTVKFMYHGKTLITQVIDRGPYVRGRSWDLTAAASEALGFEGVGRVRYAVALSPTRPTTSR
jgi:rare lipoprotein A (peptidoglycan hydrolase)